MKKIGFDLHAKSLQLKLFFCAKKYSKIFEFLEINSLAQFCSFIILIKRIRSNQFTKSLSNKIIWFIDFGWNSIVLNSSLAAMFTTFFVLQVLIVDDIEDWSPNTSRDVSSYILPKENTTIIYPKILKQILKQKLDILIIVSR